MKSRYHPTRKIDRLSNLPDDVRNLIVSFLPMEEAMRTTILSRTWRFFCFSLPNMVFNQRNFYRMCPRKDFGDFVDHILERRNEQSIQRFCLSVYPGWNQISNRRINQWISFAVRHGVCKFNFEALKRSSLKFPRCLLTCTTLTSLKLFRIIIKSPFVFACPSLKKLYLEIVHCVRESGIISLNCDCPLLETLRLWVTDRCDTLVIFAPAAKYVYLDDCLADRIILSFPNLLKIEYSGDAQPELTSETLLSLLKAKFDINLYEGSRPTKAMMAFLNIEILSLSESYMKLLSRDSLSPFPVTYSNLRKLTVGLEPVMKEVLLLTSLLRCCPNLLLLKIVYRGHTYNTPTDLLNIEGFSASEIHNEYMLKHLKKVYYDSICGNEAEMYLVSYLLQHATEMETLYITYFASNKENGKRIRNKLKSFPRASSRVRLDLFFDD